MANLKDLIVSGVSRFISDIFANNVKANKFITNNGTSSQFVKGDGTLDSSTYLTQHQSISGKADKVSNSTSGNFAGLDANGNLTDSGIASSNIVSIYSGSSAPTNDIGNNGDIYIQTI